MLSTADEYTCTVTAQHSIQQRTKHDHNVEQYLPVFDVLLCKLASAWHFMSIWAFSTTLAFSLDKETADWSPVPLQHTQK